MLKIIKNKFGLSMAEAVVAISVVTIGLLGVSSLVLQNIKVRAINKHSVVASMLAQEGLELTRNIRDQNWLDLINNTLLPPDYWKDKISSGGVTTFAISYNTAPDQSVNSLSDAGAELRLTGNYYTHSGGTQTGYRRLITVTDHGHYLEVTAAVSAGSLDYAAETYLYNWR